MCVCFSFSCWPLARRRLSSTVSVPWPTGLTYRKIKTHWKANYRLMILGCCELFQIHCRCVSKPLCILLTIQFHQHLWPTIAKFCGNPGETESLPINAFYIVIILMIVICCSCVTSKYTQCWCRRKKLPVTLNSGETQRRVNGYKAGFKVQPATCRLYQMQGKWTNSHQQRGVGGRQITHTWEQVWKDTLLCCLKAYSTKVNCLN